MYVLWKENAKKRGRGGKKGERGAKVATINRWRFNRDTLPTLWRGKKGGGGGGGGEWMDGWMEKRIEIGEWRTKRERKETREKERSRETIVNDGRLKCPLGPEAGSRGQPGLDWQMIREICIRCEVFACQFGWKSRAYAYPAICSLSVLPWTKTEEIKMYALSLFLVGLSPFVESVRRSLPLSLSVPCLFLLNCSRKMRRSKSGI